MGQGSDSIDQTLGEYEWDEQQRGLTFGDWTMRDGSKINVSKMTLRHLQGAMRVASEAAQRACDTASEELWNNWVSVFEDEISRRPKPVPKLFAGVKAPTRGSKAKMVCHCGNEYEARTADLARGWGLSCGKRCAAIRRDFGRPAATRK